MITIDPHELMVPVRVQLGVLSRMKEGVPFVMV